MALFPLASSYRHLRTWLAARPYVLVFLAFAVIQAVPFCYRVDSEWDEVYVATSIRLAAGEDIYQGNLGYLYPPFAAFCALPFSWLPPLADRLLWYALNLAALAALSMCAWRLAGGGKHHEWAWWLGQLCAFRFVLDGLAHQQTDVVIGGLVLGGCWALAHARANTAGILWGLAAAVKCTPLLWVGYLCWRGQWKAAVLLICVAVSVNLLPEFINRSPQGGTWVQQWWTSFAVPSQQADRYPGTWGADIYYNQSLSGAVNRALVSETSWSNGDLTVHTRALPPAPRTVRFVFLALAAALALAALSAVGWPRKGVPVADNQPTPGRFALECSLVLTLMLLLSPMSSKPHFCTLLLPAFCVARAAAARRKSIYRVILVVCQLLNLVAMRDLVGFPLSVTALWYGALTWITLLLMLGCCGLLWLRQRPGAAKPALVESLAQRAAA
jgi:hypothetical protein